MKNLIILGASGSSLDVLSIIDEINKKNKIYNFLGFLDDNPKKISNKYKKKILGKFKDIKKFKKSYFIIGTGNENNFFNREKIISKLNIPLKYFPNIIHPSAQINKDFKNGYGNIVHSYVTISRDVKIGSFVNILPKSTINHDVNIGSYTIINSNVILSGDIKIGKSCYIGQGANIRDHISIGNLSLIGMGSVVTKSLKGKGVYYGCPAKFIRNI